MKTRTYATPTQDDPARKLGKSHHAPKLSNIHHAAALAATPAGAARVLAMQHAMGNAATQRAMSEHAHGRECSCLACKPRINQASARWEKESNHQHKPDAAEASAEHTEVAKPVSSTAFMASGDVQRWWDDDENEDGGSSSSSSGSSSDSGGGSWLSQINPFSSDDNQNETPASSGGSNVATGSTHSDDSDGGGSWLNQINPFSSDDKQDENGGGDEGSWFNKLNPFSSDDKQDDEGGGDESIWSKLNPFGGDKDEGDDDSGGGFLGDWNPFKDFNPFGGFNPLAGVDIPDKPPEWWPTSWWPFGGDKDDEGGDEDKPNGDRNPMPVGDTLADSAVLSGGHTVGCMVSADEAPPGLIASMSRFGQPDSDGMVSIKVNPQLNTSTTVNENFDESSQHPLAQMNATTSIGLSTNTDIKRNDGFAAATNQYGTTDGKYQLKGQKWSYDDKSNVLNLTDTLQQDIVWGINSSKTIAIKNADDPQINEFNYKTVIESMEHFANRTGAEGPGTSNPEYWSPALTERHEQVHVKQLQDRVAKEAPDLSSRIGALSIHVPSWWLWTQAESGWDKRERADVTIQLENAIIAPGAIFEKWARETSKNYAAMCEAPAYADGRGEFQKVADQIRARAKKEKWE